LKNFFLLVDDLLPGSSAKGYVGSHTLGNLDHVEVFLETVDCNTIPTTVMDCIALRRGVKPFLLKTYTEKDPTTGAYDHYKKRDHESPV
jgi:hypothetical protein